MELFVYSVSAKLQKSLTEGHRSCHGLVVVMRSTRGKRKIAKAEQVRHVLIQNDEDQDRAWDVDPAMYV